MPTVTQGEPAFVIPKMRKGNKFLPKLSFYEASLFGGPDNRWRVMEGQSWITRPGQKYFYLTSKGVAALINKYVAAGLGKEPSCKVPPSIPVKADVIYIPPNFDDEPIQTAIRVEPYKNEYNEWETKVFFVPHPVLLADLKLPRKNTKLKWSRSED